MSEPMNRRLSAEQPRWPSDEFAGASTNRFSEPKQLAHGQRMGVLEARSGVTHKEK
jgi:hypothetical protein